MTSFNTLDAAQIDRANPDLYKGSIGQRVGIPYNCAVSSTTNSDSISHGSATDSNENGRENRRVKVDAFVKVDGGNDREYVFRTRDLSDGGLFLYTKVTHIYPIAVGNVLTLELYDYDDHITCQVVVVRIVQPSSKESEDYPTGFGVKINDINDANKSRLQEMLSRLSDGVAPY